LSAKRIETTNFIGYDFSPDTQVVSSARLKAKSVGKAFAFAFTTHFL